MFIGRLLLGIIGILSFVICFICLINSKLKSPNDPIMGELLGCICGLVGAIFAFYNLQISPPEIYRNTDRSAVVLSSEFGTEIEFKLSTDENEPWLDYVGPIQLQNSTVLYARSRWFMLYSEGIMAEVFVEENGLVYLGDADKPGESFLSIEEVSYFYRDKTEDSASNYYAGYQMHPDDFEVLGETINGEIREISDFTYSPSELVEGVNEITIRYEFSDELPPLEKTIQITAEAPQIMDLNVAVADGDVYTDTDLKSILTVTALYENGMAERVNDYFISQEALIEGENNIVISFGNMSKEIRINAVDRANIIGQESESNDLLEGANPIDVNVRYTGTLSDEEDIDYYEFEVEQKGKIYLAFRHAKIDDSGTFWDISILSAEDQEILSLDSTGENVESVSDAARVSPGTYFLRIENRYYSDEAYTFLISYSAEDESYETEPNDDLTNQSMVISSNTEYTGNLSSSYDIDYYQINISEKSKFWFTFSHEKMNENSSLWNISLLTDSDSTLIDFDVQGSVANSTSDCVRVPPGNYYVRVSPVHYSNADYSFSLCSETEDTSTENEPNDDYSSATSITVGSSMTGNIQNSNDQDFYVFQLGSNTDLSLTFSHAKQDSNYAFWRVQLYDLNSSDAIETSEGESTIRIYGNSEENLVRYWTDLPMGTYYLKVYPNSYCNDDYRLTLS